ncbi:hypothetical protein NAEGRDRAFT_78070 [Naegleria gruberi]|uniref:Heparan-alpha-glucosaminide N-acetyltransferase catalytic domain-containing protein n=1 Tax=Naegleria gruberi TaxID=5762 RepID=D2V0S8_NAEGR|nr:uncharacterized protein NAEGRDRAFT_78070 [Naegleria gruberi]EFC49782.1 hypothetical protein NAEGRDRAFT_78070 [Naegleria gruberi]|eukprot:XP_002682526.1 hypothetical protein NAEGRDRAFT_78070 [Naegleria gruberi strain NEG-M]
MSELGLKLRKLFKWQSSEKNSEAQQLLSSGTAVNNNEDPSPSSSAAVTVTTAEITTTNTPPRKERMVALDIMRGMTIMLMIIVNNQPARAFIPLDHAEWFGFTPTDCVFPFFLFVMGYAAAIVYSREWPSDVYLYPPSHVKLSIQSYFRELCGKKQDLMDENEKKEEESIKFMYLIPMRKSLYEFVSKWVKLFRRPILMFLIGFSFSVLAHLFNFTHVRVMGVFQRIAICYFIVSLILVMVPWTFVQILIVVLFQAIYITVTFGLYVPMEGEGDGCGTRGELYEPRCTAEGYIDRLILSRDHIYLQDSYDPEGFLSSLSAVTNAFVGILAFKVARAAGKDAHKRLNYWFIMGSLMILAALAIDYAGLPIGKKLWTTSFALITSGIALLECTISLDWFKSIDNVLCSNFGCYHNAQDSSASQWKAK